MLGPDWQKNERGAALYNLVETFDEQLEAAQNIEEWNREINNLQSYINYNERIFSVFVTDLGKLEIQVNINQTIITLFKELKYLNQAKLKITAFLTFTADDAKSIYPSAINLKEALKTFYNNLRKLDENSEKLVVYHKSEIYNLFKQSANITWNCREQLKKFVERFAVMVLF